MLFVNISSSVASFLLFIAYFVDMIGLRNVLSSSSGGFARKMLGMNMRSFAKVPRQGKPNSYEGIGYGNISGANDKQKSAIHMADNNSKPPPPPPPTTLKGKLVDMWQKYGLLFMASYTTVYVTTIGGFFFLIDGNYLTIDSMGISYEAAIDQV